MPYCGRAENRRRLYPFPHFAEKGRRQMSDNLSSEQIEILRFLRGQEGCTVSRERFFEAFPSVKLKTYTALDKLGYILLKTAADPISLTDSGKGLIEAYLKQESELQYQHGFNDKTLKASDESNAIAREANKRADRANAISLVALVISAIAILVSIFVR